MFEISAISSLDDETYNTFLDLLKGKFNVPVKQRNDKQESTPIHFWGNHDHYSLKARRSARKPVLRKSVVLDSSCPPT